MPGKLVDEIMVSAEHGRGWRVNKGQTMRIIAIEGPQVGDLTMFNAHNYAEAYDPALSYWFGHREGTGDGHKIKYLYSRPPRMNVMFEVTDDPVARHWIICGGRCNQRSYEVRGAKKQYRSCQSNLEEVIAEYGITPDRVPDVFNLWMNCEQKPDGGFEVRPSKAKKGDHIDFLAHMDCLVALSSCPGNHTDLGMVININDGNNKPLKVEIYE